MVIAGRTETFKTIEEKIAQRYPEVKVKDKEDYWFWRALPRSTKTRSLAIHNTIWLANFSAMTLGHEYCHIEDQKNQGLFKWLAGYFWPQFCAIPLLMVGILSIILNIGIYSLIPIGLALIAGLPWPSKKRLSKELYGYTINLAAEYWATGAISLEHKKKIVDSLSGWGYYKMVWKRSTAENAVDIIATMIENNSLFFTESQAYTDVYQAFKTNRILKTRQN